RAGCPSNRTHSPQYATLRYPPPLGPGMRSPSMRLRTRAGRASIASLATALPLWGLVLALVVPRLAVAGPARQYVRARLSLGYDPNLLDATDTERAAFDRHDPNWYFAVNSMDDMFLDGEIGAQWRLAHGGARPALGLRAERKQYLQNPIRSENR